MYTNINECKCPPTYEIANFIKKISLEDDVFNKCKTEYENAANFLDKIPGLLENKPYLYPQGSMKYQTILSPQYGGGKVDLDFVYALNFNYREISPYDFRRIVKSALNDYISYKKVGINLIEKKRCLTLDYSNVEGFKELGFQMDILPAIKNPQSDGEYAPEDAILLTDNTFKGYYNVNGEWDYSNPKGYALWLENVFSNNLIRKHYDPLTERDLLSNLFLGIAIFFKWHFVNYYSKFGAGRIPSSISILTMVCYTIDNAKHSCVEYLKKIDFSSNKIADYFYWNFLWIVLEKLKSRFNCENCLKNILKNPAENREDFSRGWNSEDIYVLKGWLARFEYDLLYNDNFRF